ATTTPLLNGPGVTTAGTTPNTYKSYPTMAEQSGSGAALPGGDDILLTDVISFEIKVLAKGRPSTSVVPEFVPLNDPRLGTITNTNFSAAGPIVFDTWSRYPTGTYINPTYNYSVWDPDAPNSPSATTVPLRIQVLAVQITIRVWDAKTQQTRQ